MPVRCQFPLPQADDEPKPRARTHGRADTRGCAPDSAARQAWTHPGPGTGTPSNGYPHRSLAPVPVRYASVDPATQRSTARQGDTWRDREETARIAENSQLAGRLRRWWQVQGSNLRRLSRRFYSTLLLAEASTADQRRCRSRLDSWPPPSAMCPCAGGPGRHGPRTATDTLRWNSYSYGRARCFRFLTCRFRLPTRTTTLSLFLPCRGRAGCRGRPLTTSDRMRGYNRGTSICG
jgi:hypothetical protein